MVYAIKFNGRNHTVGVNNDALLVTLTRNRRRYRNCWHRSSRIDRSWQAESIAAVTKSRRAEIKVQR